jgi:hypothetical protein
MSVKLQSLVLVVIVVGCGQPDSASDAEAERRSVAIDTPNVTDTGLVQTRADWSDFVRTLSRHPDSAARALESYRQRLGLPFLFSVRDSASAAARAGVTIDEEGTPCGASLTAFMRSLPVDHPLLVPTAAMEFDSTGRVLRRWPLPGDADFHEMVRGVVGDELIVDYRDRDSVYLRITPGGAYRVSAEPPPPLEGELWIEVADSTYLRVHPEGRVTSYLSPRNRDDPGTWVPEGDSGWYVRVDSHLAPRTRARAMPMPWAPQPAMIPCPSTSAFEGMLCRGFPEGQRQRRIAYPVPCS